MTVAKAIARAWSDAEFKDRLVNDPHAALAEAGVDVGSDITVKVVENTADTVHVVLPVMPSSADPLDMDELENLAGGTDLGVVFPVL